MGLVQVHITIRASPHGSRASPRCPNLTNSVHFHCIDWRPMLVLIGNPSQLNAERNLKPRQIISTLKEAVYKS